MRNLLKFSLILIALISCKSDEFQYEYVLFNNGDIRFWRDEIDSEYRDKIEDGDFLIDSAEGDTLKAGIFRDGFKIGKWTYYPSNKYQVYVDWLVYKGEGKSIAGYGAPAKGNTLLNYCGIRTDFIDYTVDLSPHKQGCFLPGTHIPVYHPDKIAETKPDYLLILPWNIRDEIMKQMAHIRDWGGSFVVLIPETNTDTNAINKIKPTIPFNTFE